MNAELEKINIWMKLINCQSILIEQIILYSDQNKSQSRSICQYYFTQNHLKE